MYGAWVTGEFGACLKCAGIPGSLSIADGPALHFGPELQPVIWTRPDSYDQRIMGKERFPELVGHQRLLPDGRAELVLGQSTAAGKSVRPTTKSALPTDRWTHLAFVVDRQEPAGTLVREWRAGQHHRDPDSSTGPWTWRC